MSHRVHVTIPESVQPLFEWMLKYDERFKGKDAQVVAHFFERGIRAAYEASLKEAEPLDADELAPLVEQTRRAMREAR